MDRKKWLISVYREANIFLDRHAPKGTNLSPTEIEELEPELHGQVQEVLTSVDSLEDIIKHSLLRNPPPDLWYGEGDWQHVLAAVASTCFTYDVMGVAIKIAEGTLPRTSPDKLFEKMDE